MSHSRVHDLLLLLATASMPIACVDREPGSDDDAGDDSDSVGDPQEQQALDDALDACRPYARKTTDCVEEVYAGEYGYSYVALVGSCVAQIGYYASYDEGCADAFVDYFVCLGELDCETLIGSNDDVQSDDDDGADAGDDGGEDTGQDGDSEEPPHPCQAVSDALDVACDFEEEQSDPGDPGTDT